MTGLSSRETGLLSEERVAAIVLSELEAGRAVVVATVLATSRSVPRRAGSKMIVFSDRRTVGSVGGGELEQRVINDAMRSFAADDPEAATIRTCTYELVDVASGDPGVCGGTTEIIIEPKYPNPTLLIIGCGHVGRAVADLAAWLGFRVVANDDRPELATAALMPGAAVVVAGPVTDALAAANLDHRSAVVVVTRNVAVDLVILPEELRTAAGYIGLMGSRRRWQVTGEQLVVAGVDAAQLSRIQTPIGVEIGAETPEEIAVSIMGSVISARRLAPNPASDDRA